MVWIIKYFANWNARFMVLAIQVIVNENQIIDTEKPRLLLLACGINLVLLTISTRLEVIPALIDSFAFY